MNLSLICALLCGLFFPSSAFSWPDLIQCKDMVDAEGRDESGGWRGGDGGGQVREGVCFHVRALSLRRSSRRSLNCQRDSA